MAKFSCGDTVLNIVTQQKGVVCEVCPPARGRQLYRVRYNESLETCLEQNLDGFFEIENPFERVRKGIFGNRDQFVLVNTTYKINNSNNNTISSLKASKTLFKAYQFKPLLKFLNSHTRRILIADEVGLGKTIEAGHILLELKAREEFKTALIVCPNSLKIKWQTELQEKFGLSFKIYESLNDAVEDLKAHPQNARGILNYEKIRAKRKDDSKSNDDTGPTNALIEFLQSGQRKYSVVLCDEAHKMRNNETQTYRGMTRILDYADSVVFLTATPIMLGENDLYNLLHLLEPYDFDNQEVFRNLISANRPFVRAISMLNANEPLPAIKELLTNSEIKETHEIGELIYSTDSTVKELYSGIPLYEKILEMLDKEDSLALRAQLQSDISAMSSINNVFSRTRKREVSTDERQQTERKAHKINICLSEREREIYDEVIDNYLESKGGVEYDIYGEEIIPKGAILGLIQKKRMVASSVNGYRLFTDNDCDVEAFCNDVSSQNNLPDSKIDNLVEIFNGVKAAGASKVIVFSIFKFTVRYLAIRLQKMGYKVFAIHGDIKEREKIIQEFKACRDFCVLLSTEVGSEGLDMQFCSHLVNYDLPWNPMVVEQRIGRIDRFGQKAAQVHIYNLVVRDSIQELIYDRLLERIGVFQGVIGDLEMILEEMTESFLKLENDLYGMNLSKAAQEKKIRDIEKAIENQKIQLDQVEEGMTNALSNDIYFQNEISKIRDQRLYVTEEELKNYVRMLVAEKLKTCVFERVNTHEYSFGVPKSTPTVLTNFITANQPLGSDFEDLFRAYRQDILEDFRETGKRVLTFEQEYAFDNKNADYVNIYNPIIIAASVHFKEAITDIGKTFQLGYHIPEEIELPKGVYYLAVYSVSTKRKIMGKEVSSDILVPVLYNVDKDMTIIDEVVNMKIFGDIQDNAKFLDTNDISDNLSAEACANMESDFTAFISDYVIRRKAEIAIKDDSQRELRLRQLKEYYAARIKKEERNIREEEQNIEWLSDEKEVSRAKNRLQLANNRLKMLHTSKDAAFEKINSSQPPIITHTLVSLSKVVMN